MAVLEAIRGAFFSDNGRVHALSTLCAEPRAFGRVVVMMAVGAKIGLLMAFLAQLRVFSACRGVLLFALDPSLLLVRMRHVGSVAVVAKRAFVTHIAVLLVVLESPDMHRSDLAERGCDEARCFVVSGLQIEIRSVASSALS